MYDYDRSTADGEQYVADPGDLEDAGLIIYDAPEPHSEDERHDLLEYLFDGGPDLETREGVERALGCASHADRL